MKRGAETVTRVIVLTVMLVIVFSIFCLPALASSRTSVFPSQLSSGKATDLPEVPDEKDDKELTRIITYVAGAAVVIAVIVVIRMLTGKKDDREIKKPEGTGLTEPIPQNGIERPGYTEPQPRDNVFVRSDDTKARDTNETLPLEQNEVKKRESGPTLFLSCRGGYMDGKEFPIGNEDGLVVTIGRDQSRTIKYPENYPAVSRRHAELWRENGELFLVDTSSNGTLLKRFGKVIPKGEKIPVNLGDVFYLGEQKNRFEIIAKY